MEQQNPHIEVIWGPATLEMLTAFCKEYLDPLDDNALSLSVQLVVEEIVVNAMQHGYGDEAGSVKVSLDIEPGTITLTIRDSTPEFNPLLFVPDDTDPGEGGRGLSLVRQLAETTLYERTSEGENILRCIFPRSTDRLK